MQGDGGAGLHWVVLSATPAILGVAPASMMLSLHLLQKAATSGTLLAEYGSDIVAAIVMGLVVMGCCGYVLHMLAVIHQEHLKVSALQMLMSAAASAHSCPASGGVPSADGSVCTSEQFP